jgi:hypothetical protein
MKYLMYLLLFSSMLSCTASHQPISPDEPLPNILGYEQAYLLKQYLDKNPDSEKFDSLVVEFLRLKQEFWNHWEAPPPPPHWGQNYLKVIFLRDTVWINHTQTDYAAFKDSIRTFLQPTGRYKNTVESISISDLNGKKRIVSKSKIDFILSPSSAGLLQPYYQATQQTIKTLKNDLSVQWYDKAYTDLDTLKSNQLDSLFRYRTFIISYEEYVNNLPPDSQP